MNKIYKSIDSIKLNDTDKEKMYNNILKQANNKKSIFSFNKVLRFATIIISVCILGLGSVYAMVKIFNWDNKFLEYFGITQEEAEQHNLENSEINESIKINDMNIIIKQATIFNDTTYLLLDVKFDSPKEILNVELNDSPLEILYGIQITKDNKEYFGNYRFIELNQDKTEGIIIAEIDTESQIKKGDKISIDFLYNTYEEGPDENGTYTKYYKDKKSIDWTIDINTNNNKIYHNFEEKIYVKNNNDIKIYPTDITITPIDITLDITLDTNLNEIPDEKLKFDQTININFKDGKTIKLNSIEEDGTSAQGSNIIGEDTDKNGNRIKSMSLHWDNIFTTNSYSKYEFNIIDINNIKDIQIGDKIFEINQ